MSNYIVLLKQVPDISQISDNVFNPETGTLIRSKLTSVINELDTKALAFVDYMRKISGQTDSKVITISMGPSSAKDVLRYSLARMADTAILISDKKLSGADTWATANPLAYAIRKVVKEIFNGDQNYFIVSGMQSIDGDTAQVPAQIAAELNLPCVAYATDAEYKNNRFEFTRIVSGGCEVVSPKTKPSVITVANYEYPLFAGLQATRQANKANIIHWTAENINATAIGVTGSKTQVTEIFPPGKTTRKSKHVTNVKEFAEIILECSKQDSLQDNQINNICDEYVLPKNRSSLLQRNFESIDKENEHYKVLIDSLAEIGIKDIDSITPQAIEKLQKTPASTYHEKTLTDMLAGLKAEKPFYDGDVWVTAEIDKQKIHGSTFELIGKARHLANSLEKKVGVVVLGKDISKFADELIHAGADIIYLLEHPLLENFEPTCYKKALSGLVSKCKPQILLYSATPKGRVLAPMVAYSLGCGLTADCTSLKIADISRKNEIAILMQTRPALGGNIMATIYTKNSPTQMLTVRPGVMKRIEKDTSRTGQIVKYSPELTDSDIATEILKTEKCEGLANLGAELIVCGGKGLQSRDNYDKLITELTQTMSDRLNLVTERGATRAAVEQGFIDRPYQIGQTGTSVGPKIYLGLGVSGAIQHMIGIANTKTIFAINNDPEAPVFKQCDYYMVDSVENIVPELIKALNNIGTAEIKS